MGIKCVLVIYKLIVSKKFLPMIQSNFIIIQLRLGIHLHSFQWEIYGSSLTGEVTCSKSHVENDVVQTSSRSDYVTP